MSKELQNKPLVEAILEVRWKLQGAAPGPQTDPHYKLLLGRLFDRMSQQYPEHEQLPAANVPDELVGHVVQHRFRVDKDLWPLVQVGPGVFTVNSTSDYTWEDFKPRVVAAVDQLFEVYPRSPDLEISSLILRYVDAVHFNFEIDDAFAFLKEKLKLNIEIPDKLFEGMGVMRMPTGMTFQSSFKCEKPSGIINIRFATGQRGGNRSIIWETTFESAGEDVPEMPNAFEQWVEDAHRITDDWFFKMIEGELERRFS